jgi:hypothetical protein
MADQRWESAWRRGARDTWATRESKWFWGVEVIGSLVIALIGGPVAALVFMVGVIVAVWVGATAGAPIQQRNELRADAESRDAPSPTSEARAAII